MLHSVILFRPFGVCLYGEFKSSRPNQTFQTTNRCCTSCLISHSLSFQVAVVVWKQQREAFLSASSQSVSGSSCCADLFLIRDFSWRLLATEGQMFVQLLELTGAERAMSADRWSHRSWVLVRHDFLFLLMPCGYRIYRLTTEWTCWTVVIESPGSRRARVQRFGSSVPS